MPKKPCRVASSIGSLLLAMVSSPAAWALEPEPGPPSEVLPIDGLVPSNANLWIYGLELDGFEAAIQCDDAGSANNDCAGTQLELSRVSHPGPRPSSDILYSSPLLGLEVGQEVRIEVSHFGNSFERRYSVGPPDIEPPTVPGDALVFLRTAPIGNEDRQVLEFAWDGSTDNSGLAYYRVDRLFDGDQKLVGVRLPNGIERHRFGLLVDPGEVVIASVRAVDIAGNVGPPTERLTAAGALAAPATCSCSHSQRHSSATLFAMVALLACAIVRPMRRLTRG